MRERVLGEPLELVLKKITREARVDLLCFTGDVADWALQEEYSQASDVFTSILSHLGLARDYLFVVPGNHDVQRETAKDAWKKMRKLLFERPDVRARIGTWAAGAGAPSGVPPDLPERVLKRQAAYLTWVEVAQNRGELLPGQREINHPTLGFRKSLKDERFPFQVHIIGLNSAWLCGDNDDKGKLIVTRDQVDWLSHQDGKPLKGFRLALMHHALSDLADWDAAEVKRALADTTDLLLHGHQHDPNAEIRAEPGRALRVLAAGSLYEGDEGDRYVNSFHVIDANLDKDGRPFRYDVTFYGWSTRGYWHRTNAMYRDSKNGKLSLRIPKGSSERRSETSKSRPHSSKKASGDRLADFTKKLKKGGLI
jgi:predicted phosphodiesterase